MGARKFLEMNKFLCKQCQLFRHPLDLVVIYLAVDGSLGLIRFNNSKRANHAKSFSHLHTAGGREANNRLTSQYCV